jgi:hypothetical protein
MLEKDMFVSEIDKMYDVIRLYRKKGFFNMKEAEHILQEIEKRIHELKMLEEEYRSKNNISGRLNAKTRREELQRLKNIVWEKQEV